jgi:hypothetical protein
MSESEQFEKLLEMLRAMLSRIQAHSRPALSVDALCYSLGLMGVAECTIRGLAQKHAVSSTYFHREVVYWLDTFNIPWAAGRNPNKSHNADQMDPFPIRERDMLKRWVENALQKDSAFASLAEHELRWFGAQHKKIKQLKSFK